ncbi:MAG: translation initiation factor IF-2 [Planctomycetota bacterium]
MKIRVHQLAKELGLTPKELMARAKDRQITIKNSLSALEDNVVALLRASLKTKPVAPPAKTREPAPKSTKPPEPEHKKKIKEEKTVPDKEPPPEPVTIPLIDKSAKIEKEIRALRPSEIEHCSTQDVSDKEHKHGKIIRKTFFKKETHPPLHFPFVKPSAGSSAAISPPVMTMPKKIKTADRKIKLVPPVTVKDISEKLGIKANQIIKKLMDHNVMLTINERLNEEALILIGLEFNYEIELEPVPDLLSKLIKEAEEKSVNNQPRAPIVTLMGHVDHGKTSLLDKIRSANIAATEAGQITQHIGAYEVMVNNKKIVFLDTPGHRSFTAMRARGANVTDIVVLVVAADDGVMPQTEEAINHARAAKVPIVAAINKVDKPGVNLMKVKQQLSSLELIPEEWGGKTIFAEVSALTGQGINNLLEMLALQAEILELKANPEQKAYGTVLEAKLTGGQGVWATVLVQNGTLRVGDVITCGRAFGKVRSMFNSYLQSSIAGFPSSPVGITGLSEVPEAGERFYVVDDIQTAKEIAENYSAKHKTGLTEITPHISLETLYSRIQTDKLKELKIIIKTDVKGSLEVIRNLLNTIIGAEKVKLKIIHTGVGQITESDILLADASDAIIVGFHVSAEERARQIAQERRIEIKLYDIIYQLSDDIKLALEGLLEPEKIEVINGHLTVRNIFKISRTGIIAGCMMTDGKVARSDQVRVKRENQIIFEGKIESLKRFKDDVREVTEGFECGIKLNNFDNIRVGDQIESYSIEKKARNFETTTSST